MSKKYEISKDELEGFIQAGKTTKEISNIFKCSQGTVNYWKIQYKITNKHFYISKEELIKLYFSGLSFTQIEQQFGLTRGVIYHWMKKYEIPARSISEAALLVEHDWGDKISESLKGHPVTLETREKIRNKHVGKVLSTEHKKKISETFKGMRLGENHPMWRGGVSTVNRNIRNMPENKAWKFQILKRDDFSCTTCNSVIGLVAHHKIELYKIIRKYNLKSVIDARDCIELWDISNGVTLCTICHRLIHKGSNWRE